MITAIIPLKLPREGWMFFAATLLLGLSGYGLLGSPGLPSAPKYRAIEEIRSGAQVVDARRSLFNDGMPIPSHLVLSDGFARQGRFNEAAALLRKPAAEEPADAETWLALAIALVEHAEGQVTPPATVAFGKAQEAFPEHPGASYFLGMAYLRSRRPEEAFRIWNELLDRSPNDAPWREDLEMRLNNLGELLAQMEGARRMFEAQANAGESITGTVE